MTGAVVVSELILFELAIIEEIVDASMAALLQKTATTSLPRLFERMR